MISNIEKYKSALNELILKGDLLYFDIFRKYDPTFTKEFAKKLEKIINSEIPKNIPDFDKEYQSWYSESLEVIRQILPHRLDDFINYYKPNKNIKRKELDCANYTISDCLNHLVVNDRWGKEVVGPEDAITKFVQQLNILKSLKRTFESSLFNIQQLIRFDLFDSELEAATELNNKGFIRSAGALAGVVLESHLLQVTNKHNIKVIKKDPSINDLNDLLKENNVIDIPTWRFIQHLADLRNLCDHKKNIEPTKENIETLISGVDKIIKTIY